MPISSSDLPVMSLVALLTFAAASLSAGAAPVRLGADCRLEDDPHEYYSRFVTFRPAEGATVHLNPPRFSWPYVPGVFPDENGAYPVNQLFTLQIANRPQFDKPNVEIKDTPLNFYNAIPVLRGADKWYWRVGYNIGTEREQWSEVLSFTIAADAAEWDRSALADPAKHLHGHPRILWNAESWPKIKGLQDTDPVSREVAQSAIRAADRDLQAGWYRNFPKDDKEPASYMQMCKGLVRLAFAHLLTDDPKYLGFKERLLRMASWPKGGYASPEGAGATDKWESHLTEYFGLLYDWFYDEWTPEERATIKNSLEWRMDHTVHSFAWQRNAGKAMNLRSLAVLCRSHDYENIMVTTTGALAIADESDMGREALELGLHYLIGITNGFGPDEGWHEGPGYGNGKMKWLMATAICCDTALPPLDFGKNPALAEYGDFFSRITPVGTEHCSFGNRAINERDWAGARATNFRRLAYLIGDGRFLKNHYETRTRLYGDTERGYSPYNPWTEYVLPYHYERPEGRLETEYSKLFKIAGWVTVNSHAPSSYEDWPDSVGMCFHCRPRGNYSHAFPSDNAFDIWAHGETIAHGGGTTANRDPYPDVSMSHNTVLVDGNGQSQDRIANRLKQVGKISAYKEGDGYVYFAGDASQAYQSVPYLDRFIRHVLYMRQRYFVMLDDLGVAGDHEPSTFQWLYHVYPEVPFEIDGERGAFSYAIGKTNVIVQHVAHVGDLQLTDREGLDGLVNPLTGEDYRKNWTNPAKKPGGREPPLFAHNVWAANRTPAHDHSFLAVIFPYRDGETPPTITRLDDLTVRVAYGKQQDTISFDANSGHKPDVVVDFEAMR